MVHCNHADMSPIYDVNYPIMIRWTIAVTCCWLQAEDQEQRYGEAAVNQCQHVGCRLKIKNNVMVKQLSINVNMSDQSYMPQLVTVSVGKNSGCLREVKEIRIPR